MNRPVRSASRVAIAALLALGAGSLTMGSGVARADDEAHVCSGTPASPGVLTGSFESVVVRGFCQVNAGIANVEGDLTVANGGALLAAFALNDKTGSGSSRLIVDGDLRVNDGAVLFLGCDPQSSPCLDDPSQSNPTLSSAPRVGEDLLGDEALGIIVHNTTIGGNVRQIGGGGGKTCTPVGIFAAFGSPAFSAYEDSHIAGNVLLHGLNSCWVGFARDRIGGDLHIDHNRLADPDAIEIILNHVGGDLVCHEDSRVWDSSELSQNLYPRVSHPNVVGGEREGQCVLASPISNPGHNGPGPF